MKSYADFLQEYIGKKGVLRRDGQAYVFLINNQKPKVEGETKLLSVGSNYAEFKDGCDDELDVVVPLGWLVVRHMCHSKMVMSGFK